MLSICSRPRATAHREAPGFPRVYHLTHRQNLASIMARGVLSHTGIARQGLQRVDISDPGVQRWRGRTEPVYQRAIHDYVPLYFNPRNAMLFSRRAVQQELVVLVFSRVRLARQEHLYTDGNAASRCTRFAPHADILEDARDVLLAPGWAGFADGKRRRCAEMLVYERIAPVCVQAVLCASGDLAQEVERQYRVPAQVPHRLYFH